MGAEAKTVGKRKKKIVRPLTQTWARVDSDGTITALAGCWTKSEMNDGGRGEHWARKRDRKDAQRAACAVLKEVAPPSLPCVVLVERLSPGTMDEHDNLRIALKHVVDCIAGWLGADDSDKRITWTYGQEKSKAYGVRITVGALS